MKVNKKQKTIMKICGTILFAVALILILDQIFNGNKNIIDKKYTGVWMIGYKFYSGETEEDLLHTFEQELHLNKDGTFYTKEVTKEINNGSYVSGTYEASNNKLTLTFEQNGENVTNILILKDNKLCTTVSCEKYYTKDKIEKHFSMFNATVTTKEE